MRNYNKVTLFAAMPFFFITGSEAIYAENHAYPSNGQTQEQQNKDEWECHQWATKKTGIDPIAMADKEIKPSATQEDSVASGAKKGIFHGMIAGAITGGDFARTIPIGTGVGALMALHRHRKEMEKQHQEYIAAYNQRAAKLKTYDNAYGACMKGREYTIN